MKLLLPLLLLLSFSSLAQQRVLFVIDSIPKHGVLLDKGWKYKEGDNPDWAKSDFNDSSWESIDPIKELALLPHVFNDQIKWLRVHFEIKDSLPKPLGIAVNQAGASEIYLNGKRVCSLGHFDTNPDKVIAYDPLEVPVYLPADSIGFYTLAIRYVLQPDVRYTNIFGLTKNRLFKATIVNLVPILHAQRSFNAYYKGLDLFVLASLFMLFILHFALYIYQRKNKTLLLLTLYFFCSSLTRVFKIIGQSQHLIEERYFLLNTANFLMSLAFILLGTVVYRMARVRYDKYYYFLIFYQTVYVIVSISIYGKPYQTLLLLLGTLYSFFILIRLVLKGIQQSIKGFVVLGFFICISVMGLALISTVILAFNYGISTYGHNDLTIGISPYLVDFIFAFSSISVPIGLSLFIGIENRETNKALTSQLELNETLKNKAIEQEIEKQQILENQNEMLEMQVEQRTAELKASQAQLIQSEKLASLGELTAGIAHEIQNPLNFVNNFSELSNELIDEVLEERKKEAGVRDESLEEEILSDLKQNLVKIYNHGKRASNIVRGMLQHSRKSTDIKELTDLNLLCDEYLRLSYHGLRAKDKTFNASFETHFDASLPKIEVIPQDIGRVILNLINNAFYAVNEQSKKNNVGYAPMVSITTQFAEKNQLQIVIQDNGSGIPDHIKEKIFQPFFTTKPSAQGTGLGLSLAYDIITKGHNGTLEVKSTEGLGAAFIITLPIQGVSKL